MKGKRETRFKFIFFRLNYEPERTKLKLKERIMQAKSMYGFTIAAFCRNVKIPRRKYYHWSRGDRDLKPHELVAIDEYLKRIGF